MSIEALETRQSCSVPTLLALSGSGFGEGRLKGVNDTPLANGSLAWVDDDGAGNKIYLHLLKDSTTAVSTTPGSIVQYADSARAGSATSGSPGPGRWIEGPCEEACSRIT